MTKAGTSGRNLASLPLRVGELLQQALQGRYEFVEFLGQGASSLVFSVRNLALGRFEALKVLFRESAEQVARFRREAQLVASLHHPHIATVYAFGEDVGFLWYTMELIEGPSLAQLLRANGPLEPRLVVQLALPLLDALEFAHSHGIVHRDIKPANIMVAPSFKPYLVDFGLARGLGGAELTQSGIALGTPAYIAPEQARGEKPDRRADIYSFAVTLYELLSGQRPYPGEDPIQVMVARMTEDPVPLLQVAPACPPELAAVVMKGMAREPEMRYASAAEMALALQAAAAFEVLPEPPNGEVLVQARPAPVELATARTQLLPRQTSAQRKLPLARLVVLAALGFVGAVGAFLALRERPSAGNLEGSFPTPTARAVVAAASSQVTEPPPAPPPSPTATPGRRATPIPLKSLRPVRPPEPLGDTVVPVEGALADTCAGVKVAALVTVAGDGSVKAARVVQGGGAPCDGEALRTLRGMRWRPAESGEGEPVEASVAVVIEFVTREGHQ